MLENWVRACPHCHLNRVRFDPGPQFSTSSSDGRVTLIWKTASCPECGGAVLAKIVNVGRDTLIDRVFPAAEGEWAVEFLPDEVEPSWAEAMTVYGSGAHHSAVVMCGRTLEAAANARGIVGATLNVQITAMLEKGLITDEFKGPMDYTRMIRNVGAHAGKSVSPESTEGAMHFTQLTLRLLFEVPAQLARLTQPTTQELADDLGDEIDLSGVPELL